MYMMLLNVLATIAAWIVVLTTIVIIILTVRMRRKYREGGVAPADNSDPKTIKLTCTKEHPFVPPRMYGEIWMHEDVVEKHPEYDGEIVIFHCPNCGIDITVDYREE